MKTGAGIGDWVCGPDEIQAYASSGGDGVISSVPWRDTRHYRPIHCLPSIKVRVLQEQTC
jgi:hypothetical protein